MRTMTSVWQPMVVIDNLCGRIVGTSTNQLSMRSTVAIRPHKLSMTTMGCQTLVIVRITRSDGVCGIGEATTIGGLSYGVESPEAIASATNQLSMRSTVAVIFCS
jgi:hypothetical protein